MKGPTLPFAIALHGGLYLAIVMDRYEGPHTAHTIDLHAGLYLAIIMDRSEGPHTGISKLGYDYFKILWKIFHNFLNFSKCFKIV
jgi:hypothetical protein